MKKFYFLLITVSHLLSAPVIASNNDSCVDAVPVILTSGMPVTVYGNDTAATADGCFYSSPTVWQAVTLPSCMDLVVSYCGNDTSRFGNVWVLLNPTCPQTCFGDIFATSFDDSTCSDGNWTLTWIGLPSGTYYIPIMSASGLLNNPGPYQITFLGTNSSSCQPQAVWPGDSNEDGLVNNTDLLAIGLGYGYVGFARDSVSINWEGKSCQDWPYIFPDGTNYKFADCNGDSLITSDDTSAIALNYGLSHPFKMGGAQGSVGPMLTVHFANDTLNDGDTAVATILLGSSQNPANNIYGLSFTLNYDTTVVQYGSVDVQFGDSWLIDQGDHISMKHKVFSEGRLDLGLTRIDHQDRSGYGAIATVKMRITTDNINGKTDLYYVLNALLNNITMVDAQGNILQAESGADSTDVHYQVSAIHELNLNDIKLSPNPASDFVMIENLASSLISIQVIDLSGRVLIANDLTKMDHGKLMVNTADLSPGLFFVKLNFQNGSIVKRFVKAE